jgi:hypothetical protein
VVIHALERCPAPVLSFEQVTAPDQMKPSLDRPCFPRRTKRVALWIAVCLPLYVLSTGPVAWGTNDAFHPAYLPDGVNIIYMPLVPLARIEWFAQLHQWWTAVVWCGSPAGYTTL